MNNETNTRNQAGYTLNPDDGVISVKNLSAYWIPEQTIREVIHGTTYIVTGSYEGQGLFTRKLERILARKLVANVNNAIQRDQDYQDKMLQSEEEESDDNGSK